MNYFFTNYHFILHHSVERYFKYILGEQIKLLTTDVPISEENIRLFLLEEEKYEEKFLKITTGIKSFNIILLGFSDNDIINLTKTNQLAANLILSLSLDSSKTVFRPSELKERLTSFFKGHGEQSLISCLGQVNYYFENYHRLANYGHYSPKGLNKNYYVPGLQNWKEFTRRFNKYSLILSSAGWVKETQAIEKQIKIINEDLDRIRKPDSFYTFEERTSQGLTDITSMIEELARQTGLPYEEA